MPQLIVCQDAQNYRVVDFSRAVTIGREEDNDLVLASPQVSRSHASIVREDGGGYVLHDHESTNATWIETRKIQRCRLGHGTTFRIANFFLTFVDEAGGDKPLVFAGIVPSGAAGGGGEDSATMLFAFEEGAVLPAMAAGAGSEEGAALLARVRDQLRGMEGADEEVMLLERLLASGLELGGTTRGFLALLDDRQELVFRATRGFDPECEHRDLRHDLVKEVMASGQPRLGQGTGKEAGEALCLPLCREGAAFGCLYLDRPGAVGCVVALEILLRHGTVLLDALGWRARVQQQRQSLTSRLASREETIIRSERMVRLYEDIRTIAPIRVPVFIFGEAGSGKELVASALHALSGRKGAYVPLNCSAIPEGIFESELFGSLRGAFHDAVDKPGRLEQAHGGTIFLDEVADMGLMLQPKLLRFLENGEITRLGDTRARRLDVRVVAATNRDVEAMIKAGEFRDDLFQRLSCFVLRVPPLRERPEDIEPLARHFLSRFAREYNWREPVIADAALELLCRHPWPGNVRQLRNVLLRLMVQTQGRTIVAADLKALSEEFGMQRSARVGSFPTLEEMERNHIREALERAEGNISDAALLVGIARSTFYQKMKKYGILSA